MLPGKTTVEDSDRSSHPVQKEEEECMDGHFATPTSGDPGDHQGGEAEVGKGINRYPVNHVITTRPSEEPKEGMMARAVCFSAKPTWLIA